MLGPIGRRLRLFLKSELDLQKDQIVQVLRERRLVRHDTVSTVDDLGWTFAGPPGKTYVSGLDFTFDDEQDRHFLDALEDVAILVRDLYAKLTRLEDGRIEIQFGRIRVTPETQQEIGIVVEVFRDEIYLIESEKPMFVWDVGANLGLASIYFAGVLGWNVAAYELFPEPASGAQKNIERCGLSDRISLKAVGVGGTNKELTLPYYRTTRGSNGLFRGEETGAGVSTMTKVRVVDAAEVVTEVVKAAGGRPILAKFDCEGAEYEIIERLESTGQLSAISAFVMEVHAIPGIEPYSIVARLLRAGFLVHRPRRPARDLSILYAFRTAAAP